MKFYFRFIIFIINWLLIVPVSNAQFYNGHQMSFGKNRVQYNSFYWQYYRFPRYDVYFYNDGKELAEYTAAIAAKKMDELENLFEYSLQKRVIFLVYNKLSDFKQSNIGLVTGDDSYNTGGVARIVDNKVFLYYENDRQHYDRQISASLSEVIFNEMMYSGSTRERLTSSTLLNIPDWYLRGLTSYIANEWDFDIENRVKDGIMSGKYEKFNQLTGDDALYAGHSVWYFISETFGRAVIPNILYMTKINKNVESGIYFVLGIPLRELRKQWLAFYQERYSNDTILPPDDISTRASLKVKRPKRYERLYQNISISPDDRYITYVTNERGQYKLWLHDTQTGKTKRLIKREHRLDQITDYSFPVTAWHPKGESFSMVVETQGVILLQTYNIANDEWTSRRLLYLEKVLDFAYADNGMRFVLSGVQKGKTDIYVYDLVSNTIQRVTDDIADDYQPRFVNGGNQIVFASNRSNDTLGVNTGKQRVTTDLFLYDYRNKASVLDRITNTPYINETQPYELRRNVFAFLSDENGVVNRYEARFDSTISYIDTITHYRYVTQTEPLTNNRRNILYQYVSSKTGSAAEIVLYKRRYKLFFYPKYAPQEQTSLPVSRFRKQLNSDMQKADSLWLKQQQKAAQQAVQQKKQVLTVPTYNPDTILIDINNYVFENERKNVGVAISSDNKVVPQPTQPEEKTTKSNELIIPHQRIYITSFYVNQLVSQVDFGFLNSSYQPYTGGAFYFNPGFNTLFKVGVNDLFEDYKLTGGMRLSADFASSEYLFSVENLKKRIDRQYLYHRQSLINNISETYRYKTTTHNLMYILKYPFSQVDAVRLTGSIRLDRYVMLSVDDQSLVYPNAYTPWLGLKAEYIFDNTRSLGINLYSGTRFKIFGEGFVNTEPKDLYVSGIDFRHYQRIHRTFIWASRFAASVSLGRSRLMYYLGAVDNWYNFSSRVPTFDYSVARNEDINWVYQAIATNMRGFPQNSRNGNVFALINNELRLPVFRYFANRPINSDFINNFQIIGFTDVGAAWTGISPLDDQNAYRTEIIKRGDVTVIVDKERAPVIAGYGFGVRSRLFGYFVRADWAWGIDGDAILDRVFYLSLNLDF